MTSFGKEALPIAANNNSTAETGNDENCAASNLDDIPGTTATMVVEPSKSGGSLMIQSNKPPVSTNTAEIIGLEIDLNPSEPEADSALRVSMQQGSTISLRESVYEYIEENGRTYHAYNPGKYIGPNDEAEQERLDLQHHLFVMTMDNKLHLAPISENPQNVLDIGTGTGIWAIQFAEQYPSASVIGTDLSPIQPQFVPPNCSFQIDDAEEEWVYPRKFDFIHGRALISCFKDPARVVSSIYAHLTPGGYFEFQDPIMPLKSVDGTLDGTSLDEWQTEYYRMYMEDVGFVDVVEKQYSWATNQWVRGKKEKLQARWLQANLQDGLAAWGLSTLSRGFGWSREKIEMLLANAREDLRNPNVHAYAECYVVYGRKPE